MNARQTARTDHLFSLLGLGANTPLYARLCAMSWEEVWISTYWSSPCIPLEEWRFLIRTTSLRNSLYLSGVIECMNLKLFVTWFGEDGFIAVWPEIRGFVSHRLFARRRAFDMVWSVMATGSFQTVPVWPAWNCLTALERMFLVDMITIQGRTLDEAQTRAVLLGLDTAAFGEVLRTLVDLRFLQVNAGRVWKDFTYQTWQVLRPSKELRFRHKASNHIVAIKTRQTW